jgi:hypothetical protein
VKNTTTYTEFMLKIAFQLWGFASGHKFELWHHVCNATNIHSSETRHTYVYMTFVTRYDFWNKIIQWRHWALDYPVDVLTCHNTNDHMSNSDGLLPRSPNISCYSQVILHFPKKNYNHNIGEDDIKMELRPRLK